MSSLSYFDQMFRLAENENGPVIIDTRHTDLLSDFDQQKVFTLIQPSNDYIDTYAVKGVNTNLPEWDHDVIGYVVAQRRWNMKTPDLMIFEDNDQALAAMKTR